MKRLAATLFGLWALAVTAAVVAPEHVSIDGLFRAERDAGPIEAQAADTKISALSATTSFSSTAEFPAAKSSANEKWQTTQIGGQVRDAKTADYTVVEADRAKVIEYTGQTAARTLSVTAAATLEAGFYFDVLNYGTYDITIDPNASETIDGATTLVLYPGSARRVISDGTNLETVVMQSAYEFAPRRRLQIVNNFASETTTGAGGYGCIETNSGTSAATTSQDANTANRPGVVRSTTGTTATGRAALTCVNNLLLGGGVAYTEWAVNVTTLSNGTDRYQFPVGFIDTLTAANQVDGAYFLYDEGGVSTGSAASANWQCVTASNSTRTFTTTSTAVAAATWVRLGIWVNAAGSSVDFQINGVTVCTHTTNIPTASGRSTGVSSLLIKSVGTTARTVDIDYATVEYDFTTVK